METQTTQQPQSQPQNFDRATEAEMLAEILENTRKTKNYMKWQLIITVGLIVIPLLATVAIIPFAISSLTSVYSGTGLDAGSASELQQLLK